MKGRLLLEKRTKKERRITIPFWCILRSHMPQDLITPTLLTLRCLILKELDDFSYFLRPTTSHFGHKSAFVQGVLERFWPLVKALIVLSCPHGPHAMVPLPCTVKPPWSILHFSGEHFVMRSMVDRLQGKSL